MTAKHVQVEACASQVAIAGVRKIRLGKVLPLKDCPDGSVAERAIHVETDAGDFKLVLRADAHGLLAIEVLNPITAL